jgi:hypothetical protein
VSLVTLFIIFGIASVIGNSIFNFFDKLTDAIVFVIKGVFRLVWQYPDYFLIAVALTFIWVAMGWL